MEDRDYMVMMQEKLLEIRRIYENLNLSPSLAG